MIIVLFVILHWYLSLFFQSVFHHRYAAHAQFTMSRTWERIFFILCYITQGSSYISAHAYGTMHRLHHSHTDKEHDPHSPANHPNFFQMMLGTRNSYNSIYKGKTEVDEKYQKNLPVWHSFDRIAHTWISRTLWICIYIGFYIMFADAWWQWLLLPVTILICTVQGAAINWWAHKFGYRNYETEDTSRNILRFDFLFWGEAYHNNHHQFPGRSNYAHKWFEFDMGYAAVRVLNKMGIIKLHTSPVH